MIIHTEVRWNLHITICCYPQAWPTRLVGTTHSPPASLHRTAAARMIYC